MMKTFEYKVGDKKVTIRLDEQRGTVSEFLVDGTTSLPTEDEMPAYAAAIALALIEHDVEVVHDDEPGTITLTHASTQWNHPSAVWNHPSALMSHL